MKQAITALTSHFAHYTKTLMHFIYEDTQVRIMSSAVMQAFRLWTKLSEDVHKITSAK